VRLDRNSAGNIPAPTPEQISEYFDSRKTAFRAPEYRKLVILPLLPESIAGSMEVSEADLRKAFDAQRERLSTPERREVQQLLFPNMEEARAAAQKINGGVKFETIASDRGLSPNDFALGTVTRRDISDPAIADMAFRLPEGKLSDPVQGRFGAALVRVTKIVPGKEPNFAEHSDAIRKILASERARRAILDLHDKIEDERASGSTVAETAEKTKLKAITVEAVDRSGRAPDGKPVENVPGLEQLLATAFSTEVGTETDPVDLRAAGGYAWFEVAGVTPSRDRPLEEVRERVVERWREDEISKRLEERAEAMKKRLDGGEKFDAVAQGMKVETRSKLTRNGKADGLDNSALGAIFETPQGKAGISVADDRITRVVFRVTGVIVPDAGGAATPRVSQLGNSLQDDLLVQYVMRMQEQVGVTVNEAAFRNVTGAAGN
jgi:peptidyl-prolyl cis-trans isomerase D